MLGPAVPPLPSLCWQKLHREPCGAIPAALLSGKDGEMRRLGKMSREKHREPLQKARRVRT